MADQLVIPAATPQGFAVAVAHEPATGRVCVVVYDHDQAPISVTWMTPYSALAVSEQLNLETSRALAAKRGELH
jgi:hypothetical protein